MHLKKLRPTECTKRQYSHWNQDSHTLKGGQCEKKTKSMVTSEMLSRTVDIHWGNSVSILVDGKLSCFSYEYRMCLSYVAHRWVVAFHTAKLCDQLDLLLNAVNK